MLGNPMLRTRESWQPSGLMSHHVSALWSNTKPCPKMCQLGKQCPPRTRSAKWLHCSTLGSTTPWCFYRTLCAFAVTSLLAVLHVISRMTETFDAHPAADKLLARHGVEALPADILVYDIEGPLFFGAVENLERALLSTHTDPKTLVIRLRLVPFMDITGIQTLENVIVKLARRGIQVVICEANTRVQHKLEKAGVLGEASPVRYADNLFEAVNPPPAS